MPKIKNWSKVTDRHVSDVNHALTATVKAWEHDKTGDFVAIQRYSEDHVWYGIKINGDEPNEAKSTLGAAEKMATWMLRQNTNGIRA